MSSLHLRLFLPRIQIGMLQLGAMSGVDNALKPHLSGEPTHTNDATVYPLEVQDGVTVEMPIDVPFFGQQVIGVGNKGGLLVLGVPNMPFVSNAVYARIRHYLASDNAVVRGQTIYYVLRLPKGEKLSVSLPPVGEIAIVVDRAALAAS